MGRKSLARKRKPVTARTNKWLATLLENLQHENLEELTIDDIAGIAGKSKSTVYEYFESKEDILLAACKTRTDQLAAAIQQTSNQELSTQELYPKLMDIFAQGTANISIAFLQSIKAHYPAAWAVVNGFTNDFVEMLQIHYQKGIDEGIYHPVSVELLAHLDRLFVVQVVTDPSIFSDQQYTLSQLVTDYLNLRLTGLLKR